MKKIVFILICLSLSLPAWSAAKKTVRLAICQIMVIDSDREGNFRRIEYALEGAHAQHADTDMKVIEVAVGRPLL